jgi:hypothetical protein
VTEPLNFYEFVDVLRRRIGDADALNPAVLHDFEELMSDYKDVTPPQWYHEVSDELQAQGHLDPASRQGRRRRSRPCPRTPLR